MKLTGDEVQHANHQDSLYRSGEDRQVKCTGVVFFPGCSLIRVWEGKLTGTVQGRERKEDLTSKSWIKRLLD